MRSHNQEMRAEDAPSLWSRYDRGFVSIVLFSKPSMPNHVSNRLTLQCGKARASKVLAAIGGRSDDGTAMLIDFNKLIPYPERFATLDREAHEWEKSHPSDPRTGRPKDGFNQGGYEWCCEHWGTKWNAYGQKRLGPTSVYFETAWSAPEPVMDALAAKFPDVPFMLEYADEAFGHNTGILRYAKGEKNHSQLEEAEAVRLYFDINADPKD